MILNKCLFVDHLSFERIYNSLVSHGDMTSKSHIIKIVNKIYIVCVLNFI